MIKNQVLLQEGDVIELTAKHCVYADVPEHFVYSNRRGVFALTHAEAFLGNEDFTYLRGKYVVVRTVTEGGGMNFDGPFPDGHHVFCESIDGKYKVDFYQTGCFTAMIPHIQPIGRATKKWVYDKK